MLALKFLLMILGIGLFASAAILVAYDVYVAARLRWLLKQTGSESGTEVMARRISRPFGPVRWKLASQFALAAIVPVLLALSIAVVPDGSAGIRVSQFSGVRPGTLYPGVHLITPLIDNVVLYDTREQVFSTAASASPESHRRSSHRASARRVEHRPGRQRSLSPRSLQARRHPPEFAATRR